MSGVGNEVGGADREGEGDDESAEVCLGMELRFRDSYQQAIFYQRVRNAAISIENSTSYSVVIRIICDGVIG